MSTAERIQRGLRHARRLHDVAARGERAFAADPGLFDRCLVLAVNAGALVEVCSDGVLTPRPGEPLAYLISAEAMGLLFDLAHPAGRRRGPAPGRYPR